MFDLDFHKRIQHGVNLMSSNDECKVLSIAQAKTLVIDKEEYINLNSFSKENLLYALELCRYFQIKPKNRFDCLKIGNKLTICK
jgi:hypothetical protein